MGLKSPDAAQNAGSFIWAKKLSEDFGDGIIKEIWEEMEHIDNPEGDNSSDGIDRVLRRKTLNGVPWDIVKEFGRFTQANYFLEDMYVDGADYRQQVTGQTTDNGVFLAYKYDEATHGLPFSINSANVRGQPDHSAWMDRWGANYIKITMSGARPGYKISFNGEGQVPYTVSLVTKTNSGPNAPTDMLLDANRDGVLWLLYDPGYTDSVLIIRNPSDTGAPEPTAWQVTLEAAQTGQALTAQTALDLNFSDLNNTDRGLLVRNIVKINTIKNQFGQVVEVPGGLKSYGAQLNYSGTGINIARVWGVSPFDNPNVNINNGGGLTTFSASQTGWQPQAPLTVATVSPRLVGSKNDVSTLSLHFNSLVSRFNQNIGVGSPDPSRTYQRGDARVDGIVNIVDALFIAQYLAKIRNAGEGSTTVVHPVNAASVKRDGPSGDYINIADPIYIAQMLASLRDDSYNLVGQGLSAAKTGRSRTIATLQSTTVEVGSATLPAGGSAQIPITVKNIGDGLGLGGYDFKVTFNPQVIRVDNVLAGSFASPTRSIDNTNGVVLLNAFQSTMPGPLGDVIVAYLAVSAIGGPGSSTPLDISITSLTNSDGGDIAATDVDGTVGIN